LTSITTPRLLALAALATGATALPTAAQAATVTSGHLDWTQVNDFSFAPGGAMTWLGYSTSGSPINAQGTASPIAPATGDTVTPASARAADAEYSWSFPNATGTYDAADGTGTIDVEGGLSYLAPPPPAGHGFDISIENPEIVLDGLSGQLYASGKGGGDNPTYDDSQPLFDLDLSNAEVTLKADGSRLITGIAPSIATVDTAFPDTYAVGAGPDRSPNTFGTFSLTIKADGADAGPTGPTGPTGVAGPVGPAGANGKDGVNGTNGKPGAAATIRTVQAVLAKAPYKGSTTRRVTVYSTKNKKLAAGTLKGRVLKVTLASKVTSLSGKVKVKVAGAQSSKTVSIPS
jgi:hypothetical protein